MSSWVFLSKDGADEYVNMFAQGSSGIVTDTRDFVYEDSTQPIVLRGILKHKIMKRCWTDQRSFYYIDTGYLGNLPNPRNPHGWKFYHRIVPNDLQHTNIRPRPDDRWRKLAQDLPRRRYGRRIIVAAPDEKPCRFYGIDQQRWIQDTMTALKDATDRPIVLRHRTANRSERVVHDPLRNVLQDDVHALVTFNSNAAVESIMAGVPAVVLAPTHAAQPVASNDLADIDNPVWPDPDKLHAWACHLAYGQFHVSELRDGTAYRILNED